MSTLDQISIQGIRSYHPNKRQTLKFQKPLTLILGENGCGKTTIIECLKFSTCSDQPKNTKSGGFVWDPKLSDHQSVKANVKLSFNDTKNNPVIVTKSLESTQKSKNITTRSIDQTITRKGESISKKCLDVDDDMCTYLGVSKAILKDVIFCHQEDSNWLLDEDKKLKEKFDSIFDVGKYDKCIDQIRKELKFISGEIKVSNINVEHLLKFREEARSKRAILDDKNMKLEKMLNDIKQIEEDVKPLEKRYHDILNVEENLSSLRVTLLSFEERLKSIIFTQEELKLVIKLEFKGNDFELDEALDNFNKNLQQKENEKNILVDKKNKEKNNENKILENISKEQVKLGQYQSDEKQYYNNVQKQNAKLISLGDEMKIELPDLTECNRTEIINNFSKNISVMNDKLDFTKKEHCTIENKLQSDIDLIRVDKAKLDQDIKIKEKQILENTSEIKKLKEAVEQVKHSADRLAILQKLTADNENKLKTLKESLSVDKIKTEINVKKQEKNNLLSKLDVVEQEVQTLQLLSREQAELDTIKSNKSIIEKKLQVLKNKVNGVLKDLLGFIPQNNLKNEFNGAFDSLSDTIKLNRKIITEKQKQLTTLEANHKHAVEKLRAKQRELSEDETALYDMCQGQEYETLLKEVNDKVEELQNHKGTVSTSGHLFKKYIQNLEDIDPSCPLCHRGFGSVDEVTELINDLKMRVKKVPNELESAVSKLEEILEKQSKLQQLKPTYTRISVLNNDEIPKLKGELENIESNLKKCREELTQLSNENKKLEIDETTAKNIQPDVLMMSSFIHDIKNLEMDEQKLVTKISNSGSIRNLQEAISEQKSLKETVTNIFNFLENKQYELDKYNEALHELQQQLNKITSEELSIKTKIQAEKGLVDKLNNLQHLESTLSLELDDARLTLGPIEENLKSCIKSLEETKKQQNIKIENDRREVKLLEKKFQEILNLQTLINDYEKKEWSLRLKETKSLLEKLTEEKMQCVETQTNIQIEIDTIKEFIANQEILKIDLENNKKLRNKLKEEIECSTKIADLKKNVGNIDVRTLTVEKKKINETLEALSKKKNIAHGREQELITSIAAFKNELMISHYKGAEQNYLHELAQVEILNRVERDLMKYMNVLEKSLNDFHAVHMQSINAIIKQLWRNIYSGNDIEYIYIETSSDDNKPLPIITKRRVFKYRVMQVKNNGVALDMRGRCSAGQKVLACLIIRMALAETFSKNCGILALDEPTTNLDETNIQSLADSLSEIVKRRSSQKSFQLIIITHDANFLRKLSARDLVDSFYQVERNNDGISIVTEKDIKLLP